MSDLIKNMRSRSVRLLSAVLALSCCTVPSMASCHPSETVIDEKETTAVTETHQTEKVSETALISDTSAVGEEVVLEERVLGSTYRAPAYSVDFADPNAADGCTNRYHVTTDMGDDVLSVSFLDSGAGYCDDPYFCLPLPKESVDSTAYHYFAMLVKSSKRDVRGELRFRTTETGEWYPCAFFDYADTDGWQLILLDLTDRNILQYGSSQATLGGNYTEFRVDPYHNTCATDTVFEIKAYGLYDSYEDALTFSDFVSTYVDETEKLPSIDYTAFWRGEAYAVPGMASRLRFLSYGFSDASPINRYLRQGFGGVVSNVNFNAQYLKDESEFDTLATVFDYASEHGMLLWIYDEYQWPSGKAFGQVLDGHEEYRATGVRHETFTGKGGTASYTCSGADIRILQADLTDTTGTHTLTLTDNDQAVTSAAAGDWTLHVYVRCYTDEGEENRADFTTLHNVDLLNPSAVRRFIELTYEKYRDELGDTFDNIEAFFTDEPQLGNRGRLGYAIWTDGLEQTFYQTYGYALNLPSIFSGNTEFDKTCRIHYYSLVSRLFREAYLEQIAAWCEENGTASSGHLLFEENMNDQVETYGGDFLQLIGSMTIPGVDLLWVDPGHLMTRNFIGNVVGIRYTVSAAKNAEKSDVMVEYNPDAVDALSETDPLGDCIAGASLTRLLGTTIYNVIDVKKSLNNAEYRKLNQYLGRLNTLLDGAVETGSVALFYPSATVQALHDADVGHTSETVSGFDAADELDRNYQEICFALLRNHYLYTVLDDQAIASAQIDSNGRLCVGNGAYSVLILPYTEYISVEALEKLVAFTELGGSVMFIGEKPTHALTIGSEDTVESLTAQLGGDVYSDYGATFFGDLETKATEKVKVTVTGAANTDVFVGEFTADGHEIVYLTDVGSLDGVCTVKYRDGYAGTVTVYYPYTGTVEIATVKAGLLNLTVPVGQAVLVVRDQIFASDTSKLSVSVTSGATVISDNAYRNYTKLRTVVLPDTVKEIGASAFAGCTSLRAVTVPDSVTEIAEDAFDGCPSTLTIRCYAGSYAVTYAEKHGIAVFVLYAKGDVNGNGKLDSNDCINFRSSYLGLTDRLEGYARNAADVNGNGILDSNDYLKIRYAILHGETL